jgi:hypothetical protein
LTSNLHHAKATVLALTRPQIHSLVKAAQRRDQNAMNLLEESWDVVAGLDPALTAAVEALCDQGQEESLPRFQSFRQDEQREARQYVNGAAGRTPRLMTAAAALLLVVFGAGALLGMTSRPVLLTSVAASVALVVAGGIMSVRIAALRFDHVFQDAGMACEHVWVAATDAVLALELQRRDMPHEFQEHLRNLTGLWAEAGLPLESLQEPVRYRLAA